jgi:hypothetical protein
MDSQKNTLTPLKSEEAMIQGILEGSPDAIGVVVVRLTCGCRKMAAVGKDGEPASKVIMFRHQAESICDLCKKDNGAYARMATSFIHWLPPGPVPEVRQMIERKALGTSSH